MFETNVALVKNRNHESYSRIFVPKDFEHHTSVSTVKDRTKEYEI